MGKSAVVLFAAAFPSCLSSGTVSPTPRVADTSISVTWTRVPTTCRPTGVSMRHIIQITVWRAAVGWGWRTAQPLPCQRCTALRGDQVKNRLSMRLSLGTVKCESARDIELGARTTWRASLTWSKWMTRNNSVYTWIEWFLHGSSRAWC